MKSDLIPTDDERQLPDLQRGLEPVRHALVAANYYAYGTFDEQNRWCIAVDDERGRVDVRIGQDGYDVELWATSPGLFMEEQNEWRRTALERLARRVLPRIQQGQLDPHQLAEWVEEEHGVAVRVAYELPFSSAADIAAFIDSRFDELESLLTTVENSLLR